MKNIKLLDLCNSDRAGRKNSRGFTLVELMVAMLIGLIVVGGATAIFLSVLQTSRQAEQVSRLHESVRFVTDILIRDIRGLAAKGVITEGTPSDALNLGLEGFSGCQTYSVSEKGELTCDGDTLVGGVSSFQVTEILSGAPAEWIGYEFAVTFLGVDGVPVSMTFSAAARNAILNRLE